MNPTTHAARSGLARGLTEFRIMVTSKQDVSFTLMMPAIILVVTYFQRDTEVEGTALSLGALTIPGVLGMLVAYTGFMSPAYTIAMEREDGTLLRAKALPNGMVGYVSGQIVRTTLEVVLLVPILLIPALIIFDGLRPDNPARLLLLVPMLLLGLLATLPIGIVIGSLAKNPRAIGGWGFLTTGGLVAISGVFFPVAVMATWLQVIAQVFPLYWIGLGMRSIFLPEGAAAVEIGESWRTLETVGVLGAWSVVGLLLAPVLLRRMARRESGSTVEARKQEALQRTG